MYKLTASEVIEMARYYKNWQEKRRLGTREQMWNFHWGAGSNNYTIWAILYKEYTGLNYQGQAWCAMYGTCIVALAFAKKYPELSHAKIIELTREFYGGDMPFNCAQFVSHHKNDGTMDHNPKVGDPVIFWTGSKYGHWGTVTSVDANGSGYTSVEGNTSGGIDKIDPDGGAVVEKWHSLTGKEYFYHPNYAPEVEEKPVETYLIATGNDGLRITANVLNIRETPGGTKKVGTYKLNDKIFPMEKTFVGHTAWYRTDKGWISAMYVEGWVLESPISRWWYVKQGYTCTINNWEKIDGIWYFFDDIGYIVDKEWIDCKGVSYYLKEGGYMATNCWIKSIAEDKWYWVDGSGAWYANKPNYTTTKEPKEYIEA